MAATAAAVPPLSPSAAAEADQEDSNMSSPLSEVDDKDANDEDLKSMQFYADNSSIAGEDQADHANDPSDSDSALSEAHSDLQSEANDTEAETERLYDTPKNRRQQDVIVDQYNEDQTFEHTPTKLRTSRTVDEETPNDDDDSASGGDDASVASSVVEDGPSSNKEGTAEDSAADDRALATSQRERERKRKRSMLADPLDPEEPLSKRTGSVVDGDAEMDDDDAGLNEVEATSVNPTSGSRSDAEDGDTPVPKEEATAEEETPQRETRASKKMTRNSSRRGIASADAADEEADSEQQPDAGEDAVAGEAENNDENVEVEGEDEADIAAKNAEELERKQAAFKDWTHIEEMFGVFRDRLYKDRLERLEEEEQSLLADTPTHPEYLNMKQCLDDRLNKKLREINAEHELRIQAHDKRAVAQRAQIWSQYYQSIRERRETTLEALNKEWYDVQTARRSAHSLPDCVLLFPKDPAQRVRNAVAYNTEVSTLAGIAKYEGFPAGPELKGASRTEVEADLNAIERVRRGRQKPPVQAREPSQASNFDKLGPAGEKFLQDTPWANPNHSSHKMPYQVHSHQDAQTGPQVGAGRGFQAGHPPADTGSKLLADSMNPASKGKGAANRQGQSPNSASMKPVGSVASIGRGSAAAAV